MLKKTIKFENLDGDEVEETFYFHYSQAELNKIGMSHGGDLEGYFKKIIASRDSERIIEAFEGFILGAVGERSPDGKTFLKKNGAIAEAFKETDAYSVLFMELLQGDGTQIQQFLRGCLPGKLQERMDANEAQSAKLKERVAVATERIQSADDAARVVVLPKPGPEDSQILDKVPAWVREGRTPTQQEMLAMTPAEFADWTKQNSKTR